MRLNPSSVLTSKPYAERRTRHAQRPPRTPLSGSEATLARHSLGHILGQFAAVLQAFRPLDDGLARRPFP